MVRKIDIEQIEDALSLTWKVFEEFEAPEYSEEGVKEFHNYIQPESIVPLIADGSLSFWGYYEGDKIVGVIGMRSLQHISLLFVAKEYHYKGIARKLISTAVEECKKQNFSLMQITVNSSPYAREFYHKVGFTDTDEEQTVNGIRFIHMLMAI